MNPDTRKLTSSSRQEALLDFSLQPSMTWASRRNSKGSFQRSTDRNAVTRLQKQVLWRSISYLANSCTQRWSRLFDDKFLRSYRVMENTAHRRSHRDALYSLACTGIGTSRASWRRSHRADKALAQRIRSHLSHTCGQCSQTYRCRRTYFRIQYMYFHWHKAETYRHRSTGNPFL